MRCHKAKEFISQEMDELLPPDATVDLTKHLDSCADCLEYREDLRLGVRVMNATTPELPDNFEWKLQLKLNQALQQAAGDTAYPWSEEEKDHWRWFRNFGAASAVGMAAVLALAMFVGPMSDVNAPEGSLSSGGSEGVVSSEPGGSTGSDRLPLFTNQSRRSGLYNPGGTQRSVSAGGGVQTGGGMFDKGWAGHDVEDLRTIQRLRHQNNQLNHRLFLQQQVIQRMGAQLDTVRVDALEMESK
jgi:hypothetical protein